jgi:hypothetical protein
MPSVYAETLKSKHSQNQTLCTYTPPVSIIFQIYKQFIVLKFLNKDLMLIFKSGSRHKFLFHFTYLDVFFYFGKYRLYTKLCKLRVILNIAVRTVYRPSTLQ